MQAPVSPANWPGRQPPLLLGLVLAGEAVHLAVAGVETVRADLLGAAPIPPRREPGEDSRHERMLEVEVMNILADRLEVGRSRVAAGSSATPRGARLAHEGGVARPAWEPSSPSKSGRRNAAPYLVRAERAAHHHAPSAASMASRRCPSRNPSPRAIAPGSCWSCRRGGGSLASRVHPHRLALGADASRPLRASPTRSIARRVPSLNPPASSPARYPRDGPNRAIEALLDNTALAGSAGSSALARKQVRGKAGPVTRKKHAPHEIPVEPELTAALDEPRDAAGGTVPRPRGRMDVLFSVGTLRTPMSPTRRAALHEAGRHRSPLRRAPDDRKN